MYKPLTIFLILILTPFCLLAEREINLKKSVEVSGQAVLLKDLVVENGALTEEELKLEILKAPLRGFKNFRPVEIAYEMQNHASLMDVSLIAPPVIKVSRVKDPDFIENVRDGVTKALKEHDPWKHFKIELEFSPEDITKINEMGNSSFELKSQIPSEDLGAVKIRVEFKENEKSKGTLTLEPVVRRKVVSIALKSDLAKGSIIKQTDLVVTQAWADGQEEKYASTFEDCIGYELTKNMVAGSRILKTNLAEPVYVKKGEILKVFVVTGSLKVGVHAKALTDGRRGETIRAKNTKSGQTIDVVLTDIQTAEVK